MPRKYKKYLIYFCILLFPLYLIFAPQSPLTPLKFRVTDLSLLPWQIISWPFKELKKLAFYHETYARYESLQKEVGTLRTRLIGHEEVLRENNRLKKLLSYKNSMVFGSVAATVIGRDPTNWNSAVIIDRGEPDGIKVGMPVISEVGVVGKIAEVGQKKSKVILVNDPGFGAAVVIERSREGAMISGTLQGICRLRYLTPKADVQVGDLVITSKMSVAFPEGLLVGQVLGLEESPSSTQPEWLVVPAVELSQLEEVLVIQK